MIFTSFHPLALKLPSIYQLALRGGSNAANGYVDVNYQGKYGGICTIFWDIKEADVACRQLGYAGASGTTRELNIQKFIISL